MKFPFELSSQKRFDVAGFGTNAVDHIIRVPVFPAFGSKVQLTDHRTLPGGEVASTLTGLGRLEWKTAYAGRFGADDEGRLGIESLRQAGVNVDLAEVVEEGYTQIAYIIVDEASGERTIIWKRDSRLAYAPADAPLEAATMSKILHMTVHDTDACIAMARKARSHGVIVSIDIDNVYDGLADLLPLVDICISSAEFPYMLIGLSDPGEAALEISRRYGCPVVGVTLGASGSLVACLGSVIQTAGCVVPGGCVDTTGAGDAFRAGFLHGLLSGEDVDKSAVMANAVAAMKCRSYGARNALPDRRELAAYLSTS